MPTLTNSEIDDIEGLLGFRLPGLYRTLLVMEGFGPIGSSGEIYDPRLVRELYESFFEDTNQLFALYVPFGCDRKAQELWVINAREETAAALWHETVPEDWPDETWLPYEEWVSRYLDPIVGENL